MSEVFIILIFWPSVVVIAALLNMLISWTFSWSELIVCFLAGIVSGYFLTSGLHPEASAVSKVFLVLSHGLIGVLSWGDVGGLSNRDIFLYWNTGVLLATVPVCALLDRATLTIGKNMNFKGGLLSILILLLKAPFTLVTSSVSLVVFFILSGIWAALIGKHSRLGFLGGAPYMEWNYKKAGSSAVTLGFTINTWYGNLSKIIGHELYHTRQYMIFRDLFIPFWLLGGIWGWISAAISKEPWKLSYFFVAHPKKEIGNPLECAAYHNGGTNPF